MLTEITTVDVIQIMEDCSISVRLKTDIVKDSQVIASSYARNVLTPGEFELAKAVLKDKYVIAESLWTKEAIAKYMSKFPQSNQSPTA
jgi:FAD synthase